MSTPLIFVTLSHTMRKKGTVFFLFFFAAIVIVAVFFWFNFVKSKKAQILIETLPASKVFINGEEIGMTPFEKELAAGEITLKLVPESFDIPLIPFEAKITLAPGVKTIVRREFGESDSTSSGEIISFNKDGSKEGSISIISIPDSTEIYLNGEYKNTTPYKISALSPGSYEILLKGVGLKDKSVTVQTFPKYSTTVTLYLSRAKEIKTEKLEEETLPSPTKKVKVIETGLGFLRVRSGPSIENEEISQVKPGEVFPLSEPDPKDGWYKIEYEEGLTGWVSEDYVKLVESEN